MAEKRSNPDQFQLRLPPGLRSQLKAWAEKNGRSMNAEIIGRLEHFPVMQTTMLDMAREAARLRDDKERLEWELDQLKDLQKRFLDKEGNLKPVLAIPQHLLDRIKLAAEENHRTLDAEAVAALKIAFPPKTIDVDLLSVFLESLVGVSAPDGNKEYLDTVNDALAKANHPWTVRAGWDGMISFYPYASPSEQPDKDGDEK